jgi:hypothetical protein
MADEATQDLGAIHLCKKNEFDSLTLYNMHII